MFKCPYCKKTNSVKAGLRKNKSGFVQKYFCKECNKYFINRRGFENMRTDPEIVITALDLRAQGLSFGKICKHILQKYNEKITRSTVLYWENKFGGMIDDFTKSFQLSHSFNAHADEVFFRTKGQRGQDFIYYWDVIDYDTKFLIADHMSSERSKEEGKKFMRKLIQSSPHTLGKYVYLYSSYAIKVS